MFELFLARIDAAALTSRANRLCTAKLTGLPARFMPIILRVFSLFVAGRAALARMGARTGNARLEAGHA